MNRGGHVTSASARCRIRNFQVDRSTLDSGRNFAHSLSDARARASHAFVGGYRQLQRPPVNEQNPPVKYSALRRPELLESPSSGDTDAIIRHQVTHIRRSIFLLF